MKELIDILMSEDKSFEGFPALVGVHVCDAGSIGADVLNRRTLS